MKSARYGGTCDVNSTRLDAGAFIRRTKQIILHLFAYTFKRIIFIGCSYRGESADGCPVGDRQPAGSLHPPTAAASAASLSNDSASSLQFKFSQEYNSPLFKASRLRSPNHHQMSLLLPVNETNQTLISILFLCILFIILFLYYLYLYFILFLLLFLF